MSPTLIGDLLRFVDLAAFLAVGFVIYLAYVYASEPATLSRYLVALFIAALIAGVFFRWAGVYAGDFVFSRYLRLGRFILALAVTFAVLIAIAFALKISDQFSRVWLTGWFVGAGGLLCLARLILGHWIGHLAERGSFANRTIIVGTGEQARRLVKHLRRSGDARIKLLGLIDDLGSERTAELGNDDILGDTEHLIEMIREDRVDQVLIGLPWQEETRIEQLVRRLGTTPVHIHLAPDLAGYHFVGRGLTQVGRLPMVNILSRPISGWDRVWKGLEDRVLAALFLAVLALPMALIALAIRLDSPGPFLFRQRRYGFNDNLVEIWKFRTMYDHLKDPDAQELTKRDDDRVTRIGRFLRRTSLDELPQLFNVLKGDMSVVGPRPHATEAKADGRLYFEVVDQYAARHRVKPGITGWAQVNGWRGETDTEDKIQKRIEHDLYYIDNWSIWFDFLIIARTIVVLFKDEKAY
jgi:Undecaprenyl-phosphate glucose phosphotransferase